MTTLKNKRILITGCSFIGSHLLEELVRLQPSHIRVVNKTNKHRSYFEHIKNVEFFTRDLRNYNEAEKSLKSVDVLFHLAADHGGRGYVDTFQASTSTNLILDGTVFRAALKQGVEKVFFASSGCVYPNYLQKDTAKKILLKETDVKTPYDADNMYGWAKLMGELTLAAYYKDYGMQSAIARFFTVYGERASESHAVIGSIAKAYIKQDPYQIWGNGKQIRNWTYVKDIVDGIIKTTQRLKNADVVNLGTQERITVDHMVQTVLTHTQHTPKHITYTKTHSGPLNRVANNSKAGKLLKWKPKTLFNKGVIKTIEWYKAHHDKKSVSKHLNLLLIPS